MGVSEKIMKQAANVARDNLVALGTCFGKFTKTRKFRLHITALDFLAPYAQPIATRVILSRDDLTKKLAELSAQQNRIKDREDNIAQKIDVLADQQKDDSEFLKDLLMSLMTTTENREVFGRN